MYYHLGYFRRWGRGLNCCNGYFLLFKFFVVECVLCSESLHEYFTQHFSNHRYTSLFQRQRDNGGKLHVPVITSVRRSILWRYKISNEKLSLCFFLTVWAFQWTNFMIIKYFRKFAKHQFVNSELKNCCSWFVTNWFLQTYTEIDCRWFAMKTFK